MTDFKPEVMAERTLLSFYTFANSETQKLGGVSLTFTTGIEAIPEQTVNIPDNLIPIVRNRHVKVSAAMMQETPEPEIDFNITYDIDVADWDVADMTVIAQQGKVKVGDFFYKDGTTHPIMWQMLITRVSVWYLQWLTVTVRRLLILQKTIPEQP